MPELTWLGKDAIRHHHLAVPFRPFVPTAAFEAPGTPPTAPAHRIIHGDNLDALKSLLPEFAGRVKCIYIDPPYNTGNKEWAYNDNVDDPRLQEWFKAHLPVDADDLSRHDKWLCMMYPRLNLLYKLLSSDGVIFISIDDNEVANLKCIMDEIFGPQNFIGQFTWVRKKKGSFLSKKIRKMTEYVLAYKRVHDQPLILYGEGAYSDKQQPLINRPNNLATLVFPPNKVLAVLKDGIYKAGKRGDSVLGLDFSDDFEVKEGLVITPLTVNGRFRWVQDFLDAELRKGTQVTLSSKFGLNALRHDQATKIKAPSSLINAESGVGTNEDATAELAAIFNNEIGESFNYAKPVSLVEYLIKAATFDDPDAIILDSFAGSGTTLHAVASLNAKEEIPGRRQCLLVEVEDYADTLTAERARRVLGGYGAVAELGGRFSYGELGAPLFDAGTGLLDPAAPPAALRQYVWWQETGTALPPPAPEAAACHPSYLGTAPDGSRVYFDYAPATPSTLNEAWLTQLTVAAPRYVVYADACTLPPAWLAAQGIVFKQIPRDLGAW
ncbi:MAG TPA: site-specific DNA-methyltransferase [Hymenobacter sp.]|uniref:site-specific DNA-methyltransferase n=1 Tax=Hymenobacter sp. TaxID=1898978 RepID=UPI002D7E2B25|nr:site-specific DNA-methyltransferase [Hymenobacter sp.]HET9502745.1 site-specific DNA-methyltransferase [Hymenobacter sp.]